MEIDPLSQIDPLSRIVVHLTIRFNETKLATGTGILSKIPFAGTGAASRFQGYNFLVTALHNLTGREPTGEIKHTLGGVPNFIEIEGFFTRLRSPLYSGGNDPNTEVPLYWIHSDGPNVDLALLPLSGPLERAGTLDQSFLDPQRNESSMSLFVSQTCYIIGFPEGLIDRPRKDVILPVWKTGHIASEPALPFNNEPVILVDATTRPGMSGAPVIVRNDRVYEPRRRLVGIYAGRTSDSSDIGRVFRPHVIHEIARRGPLHAPIGW